MGAGLRFGRPLNRKDGLDYCRAVLILQSKTVLVSHHPIKLFSFDGKTWFSTADAGVSDYRLNPLRTGVAVAKKRDNCGLRLRFCCQVGKLIVAPYFPRAALLS